MKKLFLVISILCILFLKKTYAFEPLFDYPLSYNTEAVISIHTIDMDNDKDIDLIVLSEHDITIWENNGYGTFELFYKSNYLPFPSSFVTADFDMDGDIDFAYTSREGFDWGGIILIWNNGDGTFSRDTEHIYKVEKNTISIISDDFDFNGTPDLAIITEYPNELSILLNRGNGLFYGPFDHDNSYYRIGDGPVSLCSGDFNDDGEIDIAIAYRDAPYISILFNQGHGIFQDTVNIGDFGSARDLITADLDGDYDLDLAAVVAGGQLAIFINNGNGTFQEAQFYELVIEAKTLLSANIDSHDVLDIIVSGGGEIAVMKNAGTGVFNIGTSFEVANDIIDLCASHLNIDKAIDIIVACQGFESVVILHNDGYGTFPTIKYFVYNQLYKNKYPPYIENYDIDLDSYNDIILYGNDSILTFLNDGKGDFSQNGSYYTEDNASALVFSDINTDSYKDIIVTNYSKNRISILENMGDGTFSPLTSINVDRKPTDVKSTDFDMDGFQDIAVCNYYGQNVQLLFNEGNGTFGDIRSFDAEYGPIAMVISDLNGDGLIDIIVQNESTGGIKVTILFNEGNREFCREVIFIKNDENDVFTKRALVGDGNKTLLSGDLDNDGDSDFIISAQKKLFLFYNDGTGQFLESDRASISLHNYISYLRLIDFNSDNLLDIVIGRKHIFFNAGDGQFDELLIPHGPSRGSTFIATDLNDDSYTDIAVNGKFGIILFFNTGNYYANNLEPTQFITSPKKFILLQNYPNPFNPVTTIKYELPVADFVEISVYNLIGQKVANLISEKQPAGVHEVVWNASQFPSGVYFYQLKSGNDFIETKKMLLLR